MSGFGHREITGLGSLGLNHLGTVYRLYVFAAMFVGVCAVSLKPIKKASTPCHTNGFVFHLLPFITVLKILSTGLCNLCCKV